MLSIHPQPSNSTHQFTPIKHNTKPHQQQQHTAETNPSPLKTIQHIDDDELFQHFHDYINVIEETAQQAQPTHIKRRLSYEDAEIPVKKLFCDENNPILSEALEQPINQQALQDRNQQLQYVCTKSVPIKVEMMAVKKTSKIFQTPPRKHKQPRQELMWATLKPIR